jgi:hypothetical protein
VQQRGESNTLLHGLFFTTKATRVYTKGTSIC